MAAALSGVRVIPAIIPSARWLFYLLANVACASRVRINPTVYCPTVIAVIMAQPQAPCQLTQHVQGTIANQSAALPARHDRSAGHQRPIDRPTLGTTAVARQFDHGRARRAIRPACTGLNGDPTTEHGALNGAV